MNYVYDRLSVMVKKLLFAAVAVWMLMYSVAFSATEINEIIVEGNGRMSDVAVKSIISYREGDTVGEAERQEMIEELWQSDIFSEVDITYDGQKMIISVAEYPLINDFIFKGNKVVKRDDIVPFLGAKIRDSYTPEVKQQVLSRLQDIYQVRGFYLADIQLEEEIKKGNRINLNFTIVEGKIATIKTITFEGNTAYSDKSLRDVISSKENAWYRFIADDDIYDEARAEVDLQLLENFYRNRGFADVQILDYNAVLSEDKRNFSLTFTLQEGKQYLMGKSYIANPEVSMDMNRFENILASNSGRKGFYYAEGVDDMLKDIANEMARQGIPFVDFDVELKRYQNDLGQDVVDTVVILKPGLRAFIERIEIRGNIRTLDKVIRRELEMVEGDPFNAAVVRASERNVNRLGFFETVEMSFEQALDPERVVVFIDVEEKTTGGAGFGIGYSSSSGGLFKINVAEENLLGRGQILDFEIERESRDITFKVGFAEPRFLGRKLTAGAEVENRNIDRISSSSYKARRTKLRTYTSYDINKKWTQTWGASVETYDMYEVRDNASASVKDEAGRTTGVTLTERLSFVDVDDYANPTDGVRASFEINAKNIGNQYQNYYVNLGTSYYRPLSEDIILTVNLGYTSVFGFSQLRMSDRLYLNSDYIRGFDKVGIRDSESGDMLGGTTRIFGGAEVDFPIFLPKSSGIKGSVFTGAAKLSGTPKKAGVTAVGDGDIRWIVGTGIKWASPIGPMRFDLSRVLRKGSNDTERQFQFTIGWSLY